DLPIPPLPPPTATMRLKNAAAERTSLVATDSAGVCSARVRIGLTLAQALPIAIRARLRFPQPKAGPLQSSATPCGAPIGTRNGFQSSYADVFPFRRIGFQLGRNGLRSSRIPACSGVRPPFLRLQAMQEQTTFSHVVSPPCERGITWSRLS